MKALIVGLGSMGRRRGRLLREYDDTIEIFGIDTQEERRTQAFHDLNITTFSTIEEACKKVNADVALISTSPLSHKALIEECLNRGLHVFTEINLVSNGYDENVALASAKNKILFLSSTFLYRKEISFIKERTKRCNCNLSYTYHTGQYLPDWHPWESYKNFFVGKKETNGCREIMAIEFPWLIDTFGEISSFYSVSRKNTSLDIDFDDQYCLVLLHTAGHMGVIALDVVSRKAARNFELFGEKLYLKWDGTPEGLSVYDYDKKQEEKIKLYDSINKRKEYSASIIEDAYLEEIKNFIESVQGISKPKYSFEKDKAVLSMIDEIEESKGV